MRIIIDTNVLIAIIPSKSIYHKVYLAIKSKYEIAITTDILLEYEEQLKFRYKFLSVDEEIKNFLEDNNIIYIEPTYAWNLITNDADDNKFVDCAIAANADFIITNDKHFDILKSIDFPIVNTLTLQEFLLML
jgi:putative PIN family toxin of toxin-antitoxin system